MTEKILKLEETAIKEDDGAPTPLFHGTKTEGGIQDYFPLSLFGTAKAANTIIDYYVDVALRKAKKHRQNGIPKPEDIPCIPPVSMQKVYLHMKNPLRMPDIGHHSDWEEWDYFFNDEYVPKSKTMKGLSRREIRACSNFIFRNPGHIPINEVENELHLGKLFSVKQMEEYRQMLSQKGKERYVLVDANYPYRDLLKTQRLIRFFEQDGYDGIVYYNEHEDVGSSSYIIFRKEQVFPAFSTEKEHTCVLPNRLETEILNKKQSDFIRKSLEERQHLLKTIQYSDESDIFFRENTKGRNR